MEEFFFLHLQHCCTCVVSTFMKSVDILRGHNLKRSNSRESIIDVIETVGQALSETEIRKRLTDENDRSTFYSSFKTLHQYNIIHKIVVDNKVVKHAHFYCQECQSVKCMDNISVQNYNLPQGYTNSETVLLIKSPCCECKNQDA